jgi:hypothetical protein
MQAHLLKDMPVCLSYALWSEWLWDYAPTFANVLIDSGAYSVLNSGKELSISDYATWVEQWRGKADAIAALDDISGDYKAGMANARMMPLGIGFPTIHDSDPLEILDELLDIARWHGNWIGIGLVPPRQGKESFVREVCERIPDGVHVHGWALGLYAHIKRLDSVDSTNWMLDAMKIKRDLPWLTFAESCELMVSKYRRWTRPEDEKKEGAMF